MGAHSQVYEGSRRSADGAAARRELVLSCPNSLPNGKSRCEHQGANNLVVIEAKAKPAVAEY